MYEGSGDLQLNLRKTECLWVFGPSGAGDFSLLVLDEVIPLESCLLFKERVAAVVRKIFASPEVV